MSVFAIIFVILPVLSLIYCIFCFVMDNVDRRRGTGYYANSYVDSDPKPPHNPIEAHMREKQERRRVESRTWQQEFDRLDLEYKRNSADWYLDTSEAEEITLQTMNGEVLRHFDGAVWRRWDEDDRR